MPKKANNYIELGKVIEKHICGIRCAESGGVIHISVI